MSNLVCHKLICFHNWGQSSLWFVIVSDGLQTMLYPSGIPTQMMKMKKVHWLRTVSKGGALYVSVTSVTYFSLLSVAIIGNQLTLCADSPAFVIVEVIGYPSKG
jgi:hypothetical protein